MEPANETGRNDADLTKAHASSTENGISRKALVTFISGAAIVFSLAVYYCMTTDHVTVGAILVGFFCAIGIFALSMYKSFK